MERVAKFLKEAETYYLATVEGDQPRVRPFGTAHIFEGKLYIQTGKVKDVSKQIKDELGIDIDKRKIVMPDVKAFGTVQAEIKVYQGISAKVFVQVSEA